MRVVISYSILSHYSDGETANKITQTNITLKKLHEKICEYNEQFPLITYPKKTLLDISRDIEDLVKLTLKDFKLKNFYFVYDCTTIYKIRHSKVYQLNNQDFSINRQTMMAIFNSTFGEYLSKGLLSREDYENNLNEDFISVNIVILQKNRPMIVTDPGEIYGRNNICPWCWNFISRIQNQEIYEEIDDDDDDFDEDNDLFY